MADLRRNRWPISNGTGGRFESERPADFIGISKTDLLESNLKGNSVNETFYNYPVFYAHIFRRIIQSGILKEPKFSERPRKALENWELAIHYELGLLLTMLDRAAFLVPLMRHCYPEKRFSNLLYKGTFSEIKLFDYHKQDKDKWPLFNLADNKDFELDIAINIDNRFWFFLILSG